MIWYIDGEFLQFILSSLCNLLSFLLFVYQTLENLKDFSSCQDSILTHPEKQVQELLLLCSAFTLRAKSISIRGL